MKKPVLFLSLLLFAVLVFINRYVLLQFMNSADEHSCYFLARCLMQGKLWATPHPLQNFFEVVHVGALNGKWFSVYPPGWPLIWSLAMRLHLTDVINPLIAATGYFFIFKEAEKIFNPQIARAGAILVLVSPFFLFTSAAYYSHNTCLLLMALLLITVRRWHETGKTQWGILTGLIIGYGLLTRYLTIAAFAFPFIAIMLIPPPFSSPRASGGGEEGGRGRKGWPGFFVALGVLIIMHLAYNFLITGNPLNPPNHYLHSHEKLGFIAGYTPVTALQYLWRRLFYLMDWTPPLIVLLWLISFFVRSQNIRISMLKWAVILVPAAYLFYYSWGGNQFGPRYYYEVYPWMVLLGMDALHQLLGKRKNKALLTNLGVALMILGTIPTGMRHGIYFRKATEERKAVYVKVSETVQKPALVFLQGFLGDTLVLAPDDTVRNEPFLDSPLVYAHDRGPENSQLFPYFKSHFRYRAFYNRKNHQAVVEALP